MLFRSASAVKELIENSIDAGADKITIEIKSGGLLQIKITDNGSGIEREDACIAFYRHATGKIKTADDLAAISTYGFRGEALAALAAVAKVELITKTKDDDIGYQIRLENGEIISEDEIGCATGTTLIVNNLFYNVPARLKFLKRDATEGAYIETIVEKSALARPDISFKLIKDGKEAVHTPGDGNLLTVIYCIYGKDIAEGLLKLDYHYENIGVSGYVSSPHLARGNRNLQSYFVNSRYVKNRTVNIAVEEAYKDNISANKFPICAVNVNIDFSLVDVNVHPAKTEIKFVNERPVFDAVYFAVKNALSNDTKKVRVSPPKPMPEIEKIELPQQVVLSDIISAQKPLYTEIVVPFKNILVKEEKQEEPPKQEEQQKREEPPKQEEAPKIKWKFLAEAMDTYLICEAGDELLMIDKHAAHERILFEKLKKQIREKHSQILIEPEIISLSKADMQTAVENSEIFKQIGFLTEPFGEQSLRVREIPMTIAQEKTKIIIDEIIQKINDNRRELTPTYIDKILYSIACKAAVKANSTQSKHEYEHLVNKLFETSDIKYCPHGRPVLISLDKSFIEKQFFRRV